MRYIDNSEMKIGDVFTDGAYGREDVRVKNRAKILYVDKYCIVWFPLNDYTARHGMAQVPTYISNDWNITSKPKKIETSELTKEELFIYKNTHLYLNAKEDISNMTIEQIKEYFKEEIID